MSGDDLRVADGLFGVFAQERAEPADPLAPHDVVGVDPPCQVGDVGDVPAHDDFRPGQVLADQLAHLPDLEKVRHDAADADDVVAAAAKLLDEAVQVRIVQQRTRSIEVGLDEHQPPGAVEEPQGERPLYPRHLIVVQLHRVLQAAAILVVLGIRAEDAAQQDIGPMSRGIVGAGEDVVKRAGKWLIDGLLMAAAFREPGANPKQVLYAGLWGRE